MAEHLTALCGRALDAAVLDSLITRAEGNAYYAEELLAASCDGSELPAGLADLLLARTERLSAGRAAGAADRRGHRAPDRRRAGQAGVRAGRARVRGGGQGGGRAPAARARTASRGYAFRHALLREAIYADLLPGERTRLHARLAELLADERRLADVPGTAAELAHHCLASHDIPGAFAASVPAAQEAERLAAPAEAHRHYDQALALWERVSEPEKLSGMAGASSRSASAISAADSGDIARAVQQLRRLLDFLGEARRPGAVLPGPASGSRISCWTSARTRPRSPRAQAAVDALPEDPPSWERARALATYARRCCCR